MVLLNLNYSGMSGRVIAVAARMKSPQNGRQAAIIRRSPSRQFQYQPLFPERAALPRASAGATLSRALVTNLPE